MKSAVLSPIIIAAIFVLALGHSGTIEMSDTRRFFMPCTFPNWSTTEDWSNSGPILHVPDM